MIIGSVVEKVIALMLAVLVVLLLLGAGLYLCWENLVRGWLRRKRGENRGRGKRIITDISYPRRG